MVSKSYLILLAASVASAGIVPRQDGGCTSSPRWNVTSLKFTEEPNFGRHIDFSASHLASTVINYQCSVAKMTNRNLPQWDSWTFEGCDPIGTGLTGLEPRLEFKFNTAKVAVGAKSAGMTMSIRSEGAEADSRSVKLTMNCDYATECDDNCDVTECKIAQFCL